MKALSQTKVRVELWTGWMFGTYTWLLDRPPPRFAVVVRSAAEADMVRAEVIVGHRAFYVSPLPVRQFAPAREGERQ